MPSVKKTRRSPTRRPLMRVLDTLGKRWSLRILWELRGAPLSFRALRSASSDVSPSVLNTRLTELRELGVVALSDDGYVLTDSGRDLGRILMQLDAWAKAHQ